MSKTFIFFLLTIYAGITVLPAQSFNQDNANPNLDFSSGNFSSWQIGWGPRTDPDSAWGEQPGAASHTIVQVYGNNWDGNAGTGNLPRVPSGLERVARLGAPAGGGYATPRAYSMRYNIQVHAAYPVLFFQLASIMDKTHSGADNTHYRFHLKNSSGNYISSQPCAGLELMPRGTGATPFSNTLSIPPTGYDNLPATGAVLYQPWQSVAVDLSAYAGQTVSLEFEHFDCVSGFHGSYEYIAAAMQSGIDTFYFCEEATQTVLRPYLPRFRSYLWSNGTTADSLVIDSPTDGAAFSCTVQSYNGCAATFRYVLKAIRTTADFSFQGAGECNRLQFQATAATGKGSISSFQWHFGDPASGANTADGPDAAHTFSAPGSYTVRLTVTSSEGCSRSLHKTVTVSPEGAVAVLGTPATYCAGDTLLFRDESATGNRRHWILDRALLADTATQLPLVLPGPGHHQLILAVRGSNGCPDSAQHDFAVHPLPEADIEALPASAPVTRPVIRFRGKPAGMAYAWDPGYNNVYPDEETFDFTYPAMIASYQVRLSVTDGNGCRDTASRQVYIMPPGIMLPNAFSPNGDGNNDVFKVVNITDQRLLECSIFNRYGQRVFYTAQPEKGWDGTFLNQPCETGTYHYVLRLMGVDGREETYRGNLLLLR